jgi:hypothetical protein
MSAVPKFETFDAFWPYYLQEHRVAATRWLHWLGTNGVVIGSAYFLVTLRPWWILLWAPACGYGFAWFSHFLIEKNKPATFTYPRWSLLADFRMWALMWAGRLGPELARAGVVG